MAKKESSFKNMVLTLFIVTAVAAFSLGGVYNLTKGPIAIAKEKKLEAAILKVVPDLLSKQEKTVMPEDGKDSLIFYTVTGIDSNISGTAIKTYTYKGFSGRITIMVGFTVDGKIYNTAVLSHKETPGLGDKMSIKKSDWCKQFIGKDPGKFKLSVTKDGGDVDAITAATITSRAFCDAVERAWKTYQKEGAEINEPVE